MGMLLTGVIKKHRFTIHNFSENTNWETVAMHMSVAKETMRKETGRVNTPMERWGFTNFPRYHADRFHTYSNYSNKIDQDMSERAKSSI